MTRQRTVLAAVMAAVLLAAVGSVIIFKPTTGNSMPGSPVPGSLASGSSVPSSPASGSPVPGSPAAGSPEPGSPLPGGRTSGSSAAGKTPDAEDVPNVVGWEFDDAKTQLEQLGWKVQRIDVSSDAPAGEVVDQNPSGMVNPGETITLSVSTGDQQPVTLPDLTGMTPGEATGVLRQFGWTGNLNTIDDPISNPQDVSRITDQEPPPGAQINRDETVNVSVGRLGG